MVRPDYAADAGGLLDVAAEFLGHDFLEDFQSSVSEF